MQVQSKDVAAVHADAFERAISIEEPVIVDGDVCLAFRHELTVQMHPLLSLLGRHSLLLNSVCATVFRSARPTPKLPTGCDVSIPYGFLFLQNRAEPRQLATRRRNCLFDRAES